MEAAIGKPSKPLYEFGPFRLDIIERLLLRDDQAVTLTPKAFDTLVVLIENRGHILEKDDLMRAIWPDTFVEENTLTSNISTLRKALGQTSGEPYIETIPKRGYRFVANVKEVHPDAGDLFVERHRRARIIIREASEEQASPPPGVVKPLPAARLVSRLSKMQWLILALLPLIALTAALVYFRTQGKSQTGGPQAKSIAVLPFHSLGAQEADEYLERGLADALITRLGNLKRITVRPTTAMQKFAGNDQDPAAAGRALGVDAVLAGHVQRSGARIRVTVQLVRVSDGATLWTEKFDGEFTEIFAVQDSISSQIAQAMMVRLTDAERSQMSNGDTVNLEAYQLYLKGRYFWNKRTPDGFKKAIECFRQAIQLDPNYALAYAGLADCYLFTLKSDEAEAAAEHALQIDEQMAEAHAALGNLKLFHDYDWPGAEREFKRAIELNPNYATAHHWFAYYLAAMGHAEEAIAEIERARQLDPLSLAINTDVGQIFFLARQYDRAIAAYQKALDMDANFINAHGSLASVYARKEMYGEAFAELLKEEELKGARPEVLAAYRKDYEALGWNGYWQKYLAKAQADRDIALDSMATVYSEVKDKAPALERLQRLCERRVGEMALLKVEPAYDNLRSDPRFADLLRRMNLAE